MKEPWIAEWSGGTLSSGYIIRNAMGEVVMDVDTHKPPTEIETAAVVRLVACVNALAGIPAVELSQHAQSRSQSAAETRELLMRAWHRLESLHSMVWGECPSLLDEDSGGGGHEDIAICELLSDLKKWKASHG